MKSKMVALLLICMTFLFCQSAHAGLIGAEVNFMVTYNPGPNPDGVTQLYAQETLTIQSPSTSIFGITVDDTSIKIRPGDNSEIPSTVQGAYYGIEIINGPLPELDWVKFATTYPDINLSENLILQDPTAFPNGFMLYIANRFSYPSDFVLSINILDARDGTVAVPEPPMIGILAIGLLAFIRSRRQKQSNTYFQ
jgi:hypothetical protein